MIGLDVSTNIKEFRKQLSRFQRQQLPFTIHRSINDALFEARGAEQVAMSRQIDRPTPFTRRGILVQRSRNKKQLRGALYIPPARWKYLNKAVNGGLSVREKSHSIPVSKQVQNKYGGMARNKVRSLSNRKGHYFAKTKSGTNALWHRKKGSAPSLLVVFKQSVNHRKRYGLWRAAEGNLSAKFIKYMRKNFEHAMRTAR